MPLNEEREIEILCALYWKGRIVVDRAVSVGVYQSMCSSILNLPPLSLQ